MTDIIDTSDFKALRSLAARWRGGMLSARFAKELDCVLDVIAARREVGGDVFYTGTHGDSITELREDALSQAMALWGEKARCEVESVGSVQGLRHSAFRFGATVWVRCLNYEEVRK